MKYCVNKQIRYRDMEDFSLEKAQSARKFHMTFSQYSQTQLVEISNNGIKYNVGKVFIKDESSRFNLNAFKVLGGSYAVGKMLEKDENIKTFITATDGNHGRGVAWSAKQCSRNSIVYMPKETQKERLDNIRSLGSDAKILDLSYDECVDKARDDARKFSYALVQDTAWDGYEEIPNLIMQGYLTMGAEIKEQMEDNIPTHIFLQAGVGSMAAAMAAFFTNVYKSKKPKIIIVEPDKADCFYKTVYANDGKIHEYTDEMDTMMAGLACGRPSKTAWEILENCAEYFVTIDDEAAARAMIELHNAKIESGESGSAGFAAFLSINDSEELRKEFGIDSNSVVLCISTEGATDRANYNRIIGK